MIIARLGTQNRPLHCSHAISAPKGSAALHELIEIGRGNDFVSQRADSVCPLIVAQDKNKIGPLGPQGNGSEQRMRNGYGQQT
jgi:hypothetical protein